MDIRFTGVVPVPRILDIAQADECCFRFLRCGVLIGAGPAG